MDTRKRIDERVRPELNLLYTVLPFKADGYLDFGWYCREHAFHCFMLDQMLHLKCTIIRGDFAFRTDSDLQDFTSLDAHADHAWCQMEDVCPLDLSITFQLIGSAIHCPQLSGGVFGAGVNGDFTVTYSTEESEFRKELAARQSTRWVGFLGRQRLEFPVDALIDNPFLLLHKPKEDGWAEVHGVSIFSKISLHLYKVFSRVLK